jgi:hypothetical protein
MAAARCTCIVELFDGDLIVDPKHCPFDHPAETKYKSVIRVLDMHAHKLP